jgi:hypothetical protein
MNPYSVSDGRRANDPGETIALPIDTANLGGVAQATC